MNVLPVWKVEVLVNIPDVPVKRRILLSLVLLSLILSVLAVAFEIGMANTPSETRDSQGRTMGFNDSLSLEHYGILLSNVRAKDVFNSKQLYAWFLLAMQATGAWILLSPSHWGKPGARWFFAAQAVLFPLGWLGFLSFPALVDSVLTSSLDREWITDGPWTACAAHPVWIAVSLVAFFTMRRSASGLGPLQPQAQVQP